MAWRVVVQPDKKYAIFSDIVDNFTLYNLTREDAVDYCFTEVKDGEEHYREQRWRLGVDKIHQDTKPSDLATWKGEAEAKVCRAEENPGRWKEELETIRTIHGARELKKVRGWVRQKRSHWPLLKKDLEKKRRFKKDDQAKTRLDGTLVKIKELLPNQWYRVDHPRNHALWRDYELDPVAG